MSRLTLIVAATLENGIGKNSGLPWRLPREMAYFARVTSNAPEGTMNAVVMGRNTWESIPAKFRPLKDRVNVVISRNQNYTLSIPEASQTPAFLRADLSSALSLLRDPNETGKPIHRVFIIGGASLYNETLQLPLSAPSFVDRILLTRIYSPTFDCDVFMPDFQKVVAAEESHAQWRKASHTELKEWVGSDVPEGTEKERGIEYEFQMWVR
ncbi:dihydrofolate reductase [Panus rudis PR-1116 ss-1]|nr:dihydrofolate reductase [Panus rudis PR-1116 ss-1]